jgi:hypothetical protein
MAPRLPRSTEMRQRDEIRLPARSRTSATNGRTAFIAESGVTMHHREAKRLEMGQTPAREELASVSLAPPPDSTAVVSGRSRPLPLGSPCGPREFARIHLGTDRLVVNG